MEAGPRNDSVQASFLISVKINRQTMKKQLDFSKMSRFIKFWSILFVARTR